MPVKSTGAAPVIRAPTNSQEIRTPTPAPIPTKTPTNTFAESIAASARATASSPAMTSSSPSGSMASVDSDPNDIMIGQILADRYKITKKLGEGGMGTVYMATHTLLEKQVALKVLHGEFARKADLVERFMQEARAASRIRHENVIDISDFGATAEGQVFFAMELLNGFDLHQVIAKAKAAKTAIPWDRSRHIFLQICAALSAAHSHGIVHRDLKPENIYLVDFLGQPDFVKLLDFGIAKLTESSDGDRKLTKTGMLFGTPEYMSPEQARGEPIDHRVDIYAMGCILYQMLTGRVPFEADNFMGILSMHLTEESPQVDLSLLASVGAPPEMAQIIDIALAKNREDRWQTIDDMANAIRSLHGEAQVEVVAPQVPLVTSQQMATASATRQRTQWTGSLQMPMEDAPSAKGKSSKGLLIGVIALVGLGGGGAAVFLATRPSAAPVVAPAVDKPLPAMVHFKLTSDPPGATVTENGQPAGQTPYEADLHGSHTVRRYQIHKDGFGDKIVELVPEANVDWPTTLTPIVAGQVAAAPVVEVASAPAAAAPAASSSGSHSHSSGGSAPSNNPVTPATNTGTPAVVPANVPAATETHADKPAAVTTDKVADKPAIPAAAPHADPEPVKVVKPAEPPKKPPGDDDDDPGLHGFSAPKPITSKPPADPSPAATP